MGLQLPSRALLSVSRFLRSVRYSVGLTPIRGNRRLVVCAAGHGVLQITVKVIIVEVGKAHISCCSPLVELIGSDIEPLGQRCAQ